ncbi:MAG: cytochrome c3 family protein [Planctomycetota bacterium]|jgi:hypothetical protein
MLTRDSKSNSATIVLLIGAVFSCALLVTSLGALHLPGDHQGYAPDQPIAFSHRLHAGELLIDCKYCHHGAEISRHAGIPASSICMNCHSIVTDTFGALRAEDELAKEEGRKPRRLVSPELQILYDSLALDEEMKPREGHTPKSIEWIKVHNVPDFVYFNHSTHVTANVACERCHGAVETMERVRQVEDLSMGWCVNCHRTVNDIGVAGHVVDASLDCAACHY